MLVVLLVYFLFFGGFEVLINFLVYIGVVDDENLVFEFLFFFEARRGGNETRHSWTERLHGRSQK